MQLPTYSNDYKQSYFPHFFSHDGKETKDLALAARRPFTALGTKTAKLASLSSLRSVRSLEQTPFLRSLRPKGPRLRSLGHSGIPIVCSNKLFEWLRLSHVLTPAFERKSLDRSRITSVSWLRRSCIKERLLLSTVVVDMIVFMAVWVSCHSPTTS